MLNPKQNHHSLTCKLLQKEETSVTLHHVEQQQEDGHFFKLYN